MYANCTGNRATSSSTHLLCTTDKRLFPVYNCCNGIDLITTRHRASHLDRAPTAMQQAPRQCTVGAASPVQHAAAGAMAVRHCSCRTDTPVRHRLQGLAENAGIPAAMQQAPRQCTVGAATPVQHAAAGATAVRHCSCRTDTPVRHRLQGLAENAGFPAAMQQAPRQCSYASAATPVQHAAAGATTVRHCSCRTDTPV